MSSADARAPLLALSLVLPLGLWACGSPPPGSVDQELAIDLGPCIRRETVCVQSGAVRAVESLIPGQEQALAIAKGGRISLPLPRPSGTAKLAWIAIGQRGYGGLQRLSLKVSDKTVELIPPAYFSRVETSFEGIVPAPDARVELSSVEGTYELVYVVARWIE